MNDKKLLKALIAKFGHNRVMSHAYTYKVTEENLIEIFKIVNEIVFSNKLKEIPIKLEIKTDKIPGKAVFCHDKNNGNTFIMVYRYARGDVFLKLISAFCHELIHYYDFFYGEWSKLTNKYELTTDFKQKEQYVERYNIHGDFFMAWVREFKKNGIVVEKYYTESIVSERFFKEDNSNEFSSEEQQLEKAIYDSIVTDGFKAVSVTKDHVYIVVE